MEQTETRATGVSFLKIDLIFWSFAFLIPLVFSSPQLVTGSIINALLLISSLKLKRVSLIPVIILPSLGTLVHGVMFGPFTPFLIYFLPFIWFGNCILISVFKFGKFLPIPLRIAFSAFLKTIFLYITASFYFNLHLVPKIFLTSMGYFQLITALIGGLLAYFFLKTTILKNE